MKTRTLLSMLTVLILGLLLVACGSETPAPAAPTTAPEPTVVEPTVAPTVAPVVEPTPEPAVEEPAELSEAALDSAVSAFIGNMVAYNTIRLEPFNELLVENPPFILDVRQPNELEEKGHIAGAVHIPLRTLGDNLDKLPGFDDPIVAYCAVGWRCTIAMTGLGILGYTNVKALVGGSFGGWVNAEYPVEPGFPPAAEPLNATTPDPAMVEHLKAFYSGLPDGWGVAEAAALDVELVEKPNLLLIDVRKSEEVEESGYIDFENQINIPIEQFMERKAEWPADKDAEIVVYCGTGHRSTIVMAILWQYGYTNVRSLKAGFNEWAKAGYPAAGVPEPEADLDGAFQAFLGNMVEYNTIRPAGLNELLIQDPPPFLLDVRQPEELEEKGHIEGAVNIPLRELADNLQYLPAFDTPIVTYCGVGWRCTIAMTALGALGYTDIKALVGGSFGGWVNDGYPVIEGAAAEPILLNAISPDPALLAELGAMLKNVPADFGVLTVDGLASELVEKPELLLIDVRTAANIAEAGVIESQDQIHIPIEEFISRMGEWPADKDGEIVVYCATGHRSTIAMSILWSYGYTNVRAVKGGINAWIEAGYPVLVVEQ